jgi:twinkle protein
MKEYMCKNMFWLDPDETDIQSVMDRAKYLIRKKGIKVLVIDPFNALTDKTKKNQKQDEYISDFLQKLRWFARKYDVAIFLVMHPTKLLKLENGLYPVCDLYNCKGASEIFDKADIGLTVWRNEQEDYAEIHVTKIKFRHLGEKGKATFKFNIQNGRYVEIADPDELRRQGVDIRTMPVSWDNSNYILAKLNNQEEQMSFVLPSVEPQSNEFATNDFDPFGSEDDSPF